MTNAGRFELGQAPTTKEAQAIADSLYSEFVGLDVDKVELIYTKFVSLISSDPIIQTLLPLTPQVCVSVTTLLFASFAACCPQLFCAMGFMGLLSNALCTVPCTQLQHVEQDIRLEQRVNVNGCIVCLNHAVAVSKRGYYTCLWS